MHHLLGTPVSPLILVHIAAFFACVETRPLERYVVQTALAVTHSEWPSGAVEKSRKGQRTKCGAERNVYKGWELADLLIPVQGCNTTEKTENEGKKYEGREEVGKDSELVGHFNRLPGHDKSWN